MSKIKQEKEYIKQKLFFPMSILDIPIHLYIYQSTLLHQHKSILLMGRDTALNV